MFPFPFDFAARAGVRSLESSVAAGQRRAGELEEKIEELERHLETYALILQAVFALLKDKNILKEEELLNQLRLFRDARADPSPIPCAKCGKEMARRQKRCYYCGEEQKAGSVFE